MMFWRVSNKIDLSDLKDQYWLLNILSIYKIISVCNIISQSDVSRYKLSKCATLTIIAGAK